MAHTWKYLESALILWTKKKTKAGQFVVFCFLSDAMVGLQPVTTWSPNPMCFMLHSICKDILSQFT